MAATAPRKTLSSFWDERAFSVSGHEILWIDVAVAAMVRGEWAGFERGLTEGLACAAKAHSEKMSPDDAAIESAAVEFRYKRDLISGADVTTWLDAAGFSAADWTDYLARDLLRSRLSPLSDATLDAHAPTTRQLHQAALTEGICSGVFDEFDQSLAGRMALAAAADGDALSADGAAPSQEAEAARLARLYAHWVNGRAADDVRRRFVRALRVEQVFRGLAQQLTTPAALASIVDAHRVDWTRLTLDTLSLSTDHAAREAVLCLKIDGLSLYEVGALARQPVRRTSLFLEDCHPERRPALLAADAGLVLGPMATDDGRFDVSRVENRVEPALEDDRVAERARQTAIRDAAGLAMRERIVRRSNR